MLLSNTFCIRIIMGFQFFNNWCPSIRTITMRNIIIRLEFFSNIFINILISLNYANMSCILFAFNMAADWGVVSSTSWDWSHLKNLWQIEHRMYALPRFCNDWEILLSPGAWHVGYNKCSSQLRWREEVEPCILNLPRPFDGGRFWMLVALSFYLFDSVGD